MIVNFLVGKLFSFLARFQDTFILRLWISCVEETFVIECPGVRAMFNPLEIIIRQESFRFDIKYSNSGPIRSTLTDGHSDQLSVFTPARTTSLGFTICPNLVGIEEDLSILQRLILIKLVFLWCIDPIRDSIILLALIVGKVIIISMSCRHRYLWEHSVLIKFFFNRLCLITLFEEIIG